MENASSARQSGHGFLEPKAHGEAAGHRRSLSGSILGRLPFLRLATDPASIAPPPPEPEADDEHNSALASALGQSQRKRRGSLRKTALLGTGRLRERRNSVLDKKAPARPVASSPAAMDVAAAADRDTTPRQFTCDDSSRTSSSDGGWMPAKLSIDTQDALASPMTSPVGLYASTTDDDDGLPFAHPASASLSSPYFPQLSPPGLATTLQRRRSTNAAHGSSLTTVHTPSDMVLDEEWDYSETEWWGWVVLLATWVVFVVGMGSCLDLWGWAWDVGETPYAPPELEDDPTLPITGYYPALMVCTAVMAWVWVVVAWVGMKYFRHAKVVAEDG